MARRADPITAEGLYEDVPYAYAAITPPHARTIHLAGACPLDRDGRVVAPGDVVAQTSVCIENMELALHAAGAAVDDVVFVRALVASAQQADLAAVWAVVHDRFGERTPPGTLMGVTALGWPDQLVEIEAVAAVVDRPPGATDGASDADQAGALEPRTDRNAPRSVSPTTSGSVR